MLVRDAVMVDMLLSYNVTIQPVDHKGNNALHLAARCKAPECLKVILTKTAPKVDQYKGTGPVCAEVNMLNYQGIYMCYMLESFC